MIKRISFRDILHIPYFKGKNEVELLPRDMDEEVKPFLWELGCNTRRGVWVMPCLHRDMNNNVAVGYSYLTYERTDPAWLSNKNASMDAHIEANTDPWLKGELYMMCRQGIGVGGFEAMCVKAAGKEGTVGSRKDETEEDFEENDSLIKTLIEIQKQVRGVIEYEE